MLIKKAGGFPLLARLIKSKVRNQLIRASSDDDISLSSVAELIFFVFTQIVFNSITGINRPSLKLSKTHKLQKVKEFITLHRPILRHWLDHYLAQILTLLSL
jgi:hypothetical protein